MTFDMNKKLICINFFGGPGSGKSYQAATLFPKIKQFTQVELVQEVAKRIVYNNHSNLLTEQDYIFAHQHRALRELIGNVQCAICDSPLALSIAYIPDWYPLSFKQYVREVFLTYDNVNIYLDRGNIAYQEYGRYQTIDQAQDVDEKTRKWLDFYRVPYTVVVNGTDTTEQEILTIVTSHLNRRGINGK
jgi:hypothetical protein